MKMKTLFLILVLIHGLIHTLGFLKAFGLSEIKELTLPISRFWGFFWLFTCVLCIVFGLTYLFNYKYWWALGLITVMSSQLIIIYFWKDAKFGTIPNVIIMLTATVGLFQFNFNNLVKVETELVKSIDHEKTEILTTDLISGLPHPVQNWLTYSGVVGKPFIRSVELDQDFKLKMKPEQEKWYNGKAKQFFNTEKSAFIWTIDLNMNPLISVKGRDLFYEGKGKMLIKVLSIIPVVDAKDNLKIDQGTLQRYLGETVWFPSAAVSPFISWEEIDQYSAKATMSFQGTSASGIFTYSDKGEFVKFSTMRYLGSDEKAELKEWIIEVEKTEIKDGIKIPTKCKATWKLEKMDWTWALIEVTDIKYN